MRPVLATLTARSKARATPRYGARPLVVGAAAVGTIAAGWALAYVAYAAAVAWLLPLLILVSAASLLRTGRTLLDRLLLAAGALVGALCVGGLVVTVWPWGLHPVALSGFAVTGLTVVSVVTGRIPQLPRPTLGDGLSVANGIVAGVIVAWPVLALSPAERLAVAAGADDLGPQLGLFDLVQRFGGYLYGAEVPTGLLGYPQGAPLLYGTLDNFARSSAAEYGPTLAALDHYLVWLAVGYAFLAVTLTWGVQRLAGELDSWRRLALVTTVGIALLMTGLFRLAVSGYPGTVLGLALSALLVVLACRPAGSSAETLLLSSALVAAVGFVFPPFLPAALLIAGTWVVRQWPRARRHPAALAILILAAVTAVVVAVTGLTHARGVPAVAGALPTGGQAAFLILTAALVVGLLGHGPVRSAVWRSFVWCVAAAGGGYVLVLLVERLSGSATDPASQYYYFAGAALQLLLGLAILGLGALLWLWPTARHRARQTPTRRATIAVAGAAVLMVGAAWGIVLGNTAVNRAIVYRVTVVPWQFAHGHLADTAAAGLVETGLAQSDRTSAAVVFSEEWRTAARAQSLLAALHRTAGTLAVSMYRDPWLHDEDHEIVSRYEEIVTGVAGPLVLICDSDRACGWAESIEDRFGARVSGIVRAEG